MKVSIRLLFPLFLGFIAIGMVSTVAAAVLPSLKAEQSLTYFQSSFILTANFLGMFVTTLLSGALADKVGKKPMLVAGGVFMTGGLAMAAFLHGFLPLAAGLVVAGLGFGLYEVGINSLCADLFADAASGDPDAASEVGAKMNLLHFFYGVGAILGPVAVTVSTRFLFWRAAFLVIALLPLATTALVVLNRYGNVGRKARSTRDGTGAQGANAADGALVRTPFGRANLAWLFLVSSALLFYVGAEVCGYGWLPLYWSGLDGRWNWLGGELMASVFWGALTLGRVLFGGFSDRIGLWKYVMTLSLAGAASAALWATMPTPMATLVFASLFALSLSGIYPSMMAIATARYPLHTGFVTAFVSAFASVAGLFIPIGAGKLSDTFGIRILPLLLMALCAGIFGMTFWARAHGRPRPSN